MGMHRQTTAVSLALLLLLSGCGSSSAPQAGAEADTSVSVSDSTTTGSDTRYETPELPTTEFHEDQAIGNDSIKIDISSADNGYITVRASCDNSLRFYLLYEDETLEDRGSYGLVLPNDGTDAVYSLTKGDGHYTLRIMECLDEGHMADFYDPVEFDVAMTDPLLPFLYSSYYVCFDDGTGCVDAGKELAAESEDALALVNNTVSYVQEVLSYDNAQAQSTTRAYVSRPNDSLERGSGICLDYAALTAAILRSQGVPTKLIMGNVEYDDDYLYHAWNMFYTEETGWMTVTFEVKGSDWNRVDVTLSDSGYDYDFIEDENNYLENEYL